MAETITPDQVLEAVGNWSLLQINDFVKKFEEKFDVKAAAPVAVAAAAGPAAEAAPAAEEKTEFTVVLKVVDAAKKIKVIKEVRALKPDLGLKEAKDLVDNLPANVLVDVSKDDAEKARKQLVEAGAEVELK
ncbi:MAG: 50S ribosomal protein L7/L12 [Candidatus Sumerlaeia bacterium]